MARSILGPPNRGSKSPTSVRPVLDTELHPSGEHTVEQDFGDLQQLLGFATLLDGVPGGLKAAVGKQLLETLVAWQAAGMSGTLLESLASSSSVLRWFAMSSKVRKISDKIERALRSGFVTPEMLHALITDPSVLSSLINFKGSTK